MARRSLRLQESGYYDEEGIPIISYREVLYKFFRRRRRQKSYHRPVGFTVLDSSWEYPDSGWGSYYTQPVRTSLWTINCFFLFFLMASGMTYHTHTLQIKLREVQQEVQSLRERMNTAAPLADTMPNFALELLGARVLHPLSSDTYLSKGVGLWDKISSWCCSSVKQRRVIQGNSALHPGECWAFPGDRGHVVIFLSHSVHISHVTLGHITKSQAPGEYTASAPREFSVYGMKTTDEEGTYLGTLEYDVDGAAFQTFNLSNPDDRIFRYVKLQINSNWGNTDYTCLYRFRVHGHIEKTSEFG